MPSRAHRLSALAAHPRTHPKTAGRIRASLRRHERRNRFAALAAHPKTSAAVGQRIRTVLGQQRG